MNYKLLFNSNLQPSTRILLSKSKNRKYSFNYGLEGLRGLAALWVVYAHLVNFDNQLDPSYHPGENPLFFLHSAHAGVLIFFILSGYVIGLTNTSAFSWRRARQYLLRRIVRLFPIYIVAIFISILFSPADNIETIFGNILFLQNILVPSLSGNVILWTLNYEVVFYLLFLLIWRYRPNTIGVMTCLFGIGLIGWLIPDFPSTISGYAVGWIFWLSGLWLAWRIPEGNESIKVPLVSYLCILAATDHFSTGDIILNGLGIGNSQYTIINLSDLALLPICLLLMACIANRVFSTTKWIQTVAYLLPIVNLTILLRAGNLFEHTSWTVSSIYVIGSLLSFKMLLRPDWLKRLSYVGSISYGIYVFHMPIMHFVHDYFPFSGSLFTFYLRVLLWLLLVFVISHFLERCLQPQIKYWAKRYIFYNS